ncbi:unnamed protein product [Citrullus colocynthis]|uniref:Uncharacterized protein n=1 Tax=Citrullus colocynthis TaxID=252529 RepID=A0ABP0Y172_9ROSI
MARFGAIELCFVRFFWVDEHHLVVENDGIGESARGQPEELHLGGTTTNRGGYKLGIQRGGMAAGRVRREKQGLGKGFGGAELGAASGNSISQSSIGISVALWVELGDGIVKPGGGGDGMAVGRRAIFSR